MEMEDYVPQKCVFFPIHYFIFHIKENDYITHTIAFYLQLKDALKILGVRLSDEEAAAFLNFIDTDHDGDVSFDEFAAFIVNYDDSHHHDHNNNR